MYTVTKKFRDKQNPGKYFYPGEKFESDNKARIKDLLSRGLIEKETKKSGTEE